MALAAQIKARQKQLAETSGVVRNLADVARPKAGRLHGVLRSRPSEDGDEPGAPGPYPRLGFSLSQQLVDLPEGGSTVIEIEQRVGPPARHARSVTVPALHEDHPVEMGHGFGVALAAKMMVAHSRMGFGQVRHQPQRLAILLDRGSFISQPFEARAKILENLRGEVRHVRQSRIAKGLQIGFLRRAFIAQRRVGVADRVVQTRRLIEAACELRLEIADRVSDPLGEPARAVHAEVDLRHVGRPEGVTVRAEDGSERLETRTDHDFAPALIEHRQGLRGERGVLRNVDGGGAAQGRRGCPRLLNTTVARSARIASGQAGQPDQTLSRQRLAEADGQRLLVGPRPALMLVLR